jgi:hypothetical protein
MGKTATQKSETHGSQTHGSQTHGSQTLGSQTLGSRTLDRSTGVEAPRKWGEAIRNAMFKLTNDELVSFLAKNPVEARRIEICLTRSKSTKNALFRFTS